jgi:hypothetical protein
MIPQRKNYPEGEDGFLKWVIARKQWRTWENAKDRLYPFLFEGDDKAWAIGMSNKIPITKAKPKKGKKNVKVKSVSLQLQGVPKAGSHQSGSNVPGRAVPGTLPPNARDEARDGGPGPASGS